MFRLVSLLLLAVLAPFARGAEEAAFLEIVRARIATLPVLDTSSRPGAPNFTIVRLNAPPILAVAERYGAVRVTCPPGKPLSLAWLFSDTTNIDEYGMVSREGMRLEQEFKRFIMPASASADPEQERAGRSSFALPRPWDLVEVHVLGVPARLLKPGGEYVIWFRFSDARPTDLLLAASFVDPAARLESADLPPLFALPAERAP